MGGNFKFQVQDSFSEYFFFKIWRSKKQITLSEKKPPLVYCSVSHGLNFVFFFKMENSLMYSKFVENTSLLYSVQVSNFNKYFFILNFNPMRLWSLKHWSNFYISQRSIIDLFHHGIFLTTCSRFYEFLLLSVMDFFL